MARAQLADHHDQSRTCGNGRIDDHEDCDGAQGQTSCEELGLGTGTVTCNGCRFDASGCSDARPEPVGCAGGAGCDVPPPDCLGMAGCMPSGRCGNGVAEGTEACDGGDLLGHSCQSLSGRNGQLRCTGSCDFDFSACTDGDPTQEACFDCGNARCPDELGACASTPDCPEGLMCTVERCLRGGMLEPDCILRCFNGSMVAAEAGFLSYQCLQDFCPDVCADIL